MGQNESTPNNNIPRSNHLATEPPLDSKSRLQIQENYHSLNTRTINAPLSTNNRTTPAIPSKSPVSQTRIFDKENNPLRERSSFLTEQKSTTTLTAPSRLSFSSRPGMNQIKRKNSEDFDTDLMEENSGIKPQNPSVAGSDKANSIVMPMENSQAIVSSINSKADSLFRTGIETKNNSGNNSLYTSKSIVNSESIQSLQKAPVIQNRLFQKEVLTVKEKNIKEREEIMVRDDDVDIRKQTFGKDTNMLSPTEFTHFQPSAAMMENKAFHNDEVRIMETGFSSSRQMNSDRYDQSPALSARIQEELPKNIIEQVHSLIPPKSRATPTSSTQSISQQSILKKPTRIDNRDPIRVPDQITKSRKLSHQDDQKYSLVIEEFQDPSPSKPKKGSINIQQDSKGFPEAEFSFKPNLMSRDRPRYSFENNSTQARDSQQKSLKQRSDKGLIRKSKSQVSRKALPAIEILESESNSSYADGPVSTESASSMSSARQPYVPRNMKKRTHSNTNSKSRRQSRAVDTSSNYSAYPYVNTNNYVQSQHSFHGQSFHPLPQGPVMTTMPGVHVIEPYQYMMSQHAYYGSPGFPPQISTPMRNNYPHYYQNLQATPQVGSMPHLGIYSSPQFYNPIQPPMHQQNYTHNFTSPSPHYMNAPLTEYSNLTGRHTPYREPSYAANRGSDSARAYYQTDANLSMNHSSRPIEKSAENIGYKGLRSSKSMSTLKVGRHTPTHEPKVGVSRVDAIPYQNQSFTDVQEMEQDRRVMSSTPTGGQKIKNVKNSGNISDIGKIERVESAGIMIENSSGVNETMISRITSNNEVQRTKKPAYQEESEGDKELNTTEYSLVQKLEGHGREASTKTLSIVSSPGRKGKENKENKEAGRKNWQILNRIGGAKGSEKEDVVLMPTDVNTKNKKNKIDLLLGNNNEHMKWEIKDFGKSNKDPDLPKPKSYSNQTLVFDAPKCKTTQNNSKSRQLSSQNRALATKKEQDEANTSQKGVKLCFDLADETDDGVGRKNGEDSSKAGDKSIAEYFKQRKHSLFSKLEEENRRFSTTSNNQTKEVDKEELIQKRRDMMKSSNKKGQVLDTVSSGAPPREFNQTPELPNMGYSGFPPSPIEGSRRTETTVLSAYSSNMVSQGSRRNTRELNGSLLERLAHGQKAKVSKKDMVALSAKNYQNLPEVKKRVEDKKKKEEKLENMKKRQEKVKDLDARLRRPKSTKRMMTGEGGSSLYMS